MFGKLKKFPNYKQADSNDCGPTCLRMVAKHYGKDISGPTIRKLVYRGTQGANLLNLSDTADQLGFRTMMVKCSLEMMEKEKPTPFIALWNQNHYVVVYKIKAGKFYISDPNGERGIIDRETFRRSWCNSKTDGEEEGIALLFETTPEFYTIEVEEVQKVGFKFYLKYIIPHSNLIMQLIIGMGLTSVFSLITPFLTQAMVDQGIQNSDINFVYVVVIAQVMMFIGNTTVGLIRSWVMLHMSTRINISVLSDFLVKLMKLPIGFFDAKNLGDIMQRMGDHSRIESFLTSHSLSIAFSFVNVIIYSFVMLTYSVEMYGIFILSSLLFTGWVVAFLRKRKELDYKNFAESSKNQNATVGLIQGMQEIKLHTCEKQRRWEWERVQIRIFKLGIKSLILEQFQGTGSSFINHVKSIVISFWAAKEVIDGDMTLGMMMAATQILGQLDGPIGQFVGFIQQAQDAKISLERLGEIHNRDNEDANTLGDEASYAIPKNGDIEIRNLSFRYGDPTGLWVLDNLSMTIPYGKTTAIVGESGSGKTTLMKLLLRFYEPEKGEIRLGDTNLQHLNAREWRKKCGAVMQEGHVFSDTIARNIAIADEIPDKKRLLAAAETANAKVFIDNLPLNYDTKIGAEGKDLSTGQKQRLRIARAVYKDPDYIFFDEASSSLDANNEREITQKINQFNKNRTAVIIAHRLSTVRHADNIVVMDKGRIVEQGTHEELTSGRGLYYDLVKNQLELGN